MRQLYVETLIRADLDEIWRRTQDPAEHSRWDLRFTEIRPDLDAPGRFTYAVRIGRRLGVSGTGVAAGERHRPDGTRTSALRFESPDPLSLIATGSGYWRYVPSPAGVRFLTGYDYTPRWGLAGRLVDRLVFRPLMGWGTAWSFDRLRLWCEHGVPPERALRRGLADAGLRVLLVAVAWTSSRLLAAALALVLTALPALPTSPAARRCRRAPLDRTEPR